MSWRRNADGIPERKFVAAETKEPQRDVDHLCDRNVAFPRIAETHGEVAPDPHPAVLRGVDDGTEHVQCLVEAAVEIAPGEALGRGREHSHVGRACPESPLEPCLVRHEYWKAHAGLRTKFRKKFLGITELRHPLGGHE